MARSSAVMDARACIFCGVLLTAENRAKEHVLRRIWLERLGQLKSPLESRRFAGTVQLPSRNLAPQALQCGEVCKGCNGGWINDLDESVDHIVMGWAGTDCRSTSLDDCEQRNLARWLLKVACTFAHTDERARRHIPASVLKGVQEPGYLPPSLLTFYVRSDKPTKGVGIGYLDFWRFSERVARVPQETRLKFAVQYDNVVFGFLMVDPTYVVPTFVVSPAITRISEYNCVADIVILPPPPDPLPMDLSLSPTTQALLWVDVSP